MEEVLEYLSENIKNEIKDYNKKIAFLCFLINLDSILAILLKIFTQT